MNRYALPRLDRIVDNYLIPQVFAGVYKMQVNRIDLVGILISLVGKYCQPGKCVTGINDVAVGACRYANMGLLYRRHFT